MTSHTLTNLEVLKLFHAEISSHSKNLKVIRQNTLTKLISTKSSTSTSDLKHFEILKVISKPLWSEIVSYKKLIIWPRYYCLKNWNNHNISHSLGQRTKRHKEYLIIYLHLYPNCSKVYFDISKHAKHFHFSNAHSQYWKSYYYGKHH